MDPPPQTAGDKPAKRAGSGQEFGAMGTLTQCYLSHGTMAVLRLGQLLACWEYLGSRTCGSQLAESAPMNLFGNLPPPRPCSFQVSDRTGSQVFIWLSVVGTDCFLPFCEVPGRP